MSGYLAAAIALLLVLTLGAGLMGSCGGSGRASGVSAESELLLAESLSGLREAYGCESAAAAAEGFAEPSVKRAKSLLDATRVAAKRAQKVKATGPRSRAAEVRAASGVSREKLAARHRKLAARQADTKDRQALATKCRMRENAACVALLRRGPPEISDGEAREALRGCFRASDGKEHMCRVAAAAGVRAGGLLQAVSLMNEYGTTKGLDMAQPSKASKAG